MRPSVLFVFMNAESVLICVAGHVYMYACDACVVYVCSCTCLCGLCAQPRCRLVTWSYDHLAPVWLQDSATPDSSTAWFGPNGSNSSFNGACSLSRAATALCCAVMCGNLVECLNSESNSKFSRNIVCVTQLFFQHVLLQ